jgi:hypothetical protein
MAPSAVVFVEEHPIMELVNRANSNTETDQNVFDRLMLVRISQQRRRAKSQDRPTVTRLSNGMAFSGGAQAPSVS